MDTLSSELFYNIETWCNVTDVAACVFVMFMMIVTAVQKWNRDIHHYLSGLIFLLNGISCHVMVRALEFAHETDGGPQLIGEAADMAARGEGPGPMQGGAAQQAGGSLFESIQHLISFFTAPGNADTLIRLMCFVFMLFSIEQFFLQAVSVKEHPDRKHSDRVRDTVLKLALVAAGIIIYLITDNDKVLTAIIMLYLLAGLYSVMKNKSFVLRRTPVAVSVLVSVFICVVALAVPEVRFTGLAFTVMYVDLYAEFHMYIETQLSVREAELAESRIRLMNEQISSHFTFNSLKVIEGMCKTDPERAGETINVFSKYLRSNLESITATEMIPFEDELEHTKQYIRLEQLEGSLPFSVQYDIAVSDFRVPPLVLEPLAENAIRHGVRQCGADTITLSTSVGDGRVLISVSDNGKADMRTAQGIAGIRGGRRSVAHDNIRSRLRLQCGGTLDIEYTDKGTTSTITIPRDSIDLNQYRG